MFFCAAADFHHVFMMDCLGFFLSCSDYSCCHVGDEGDTEDFDSHVACDDGFVDGGHADEIGSEGAECTDFSRGFEAGADDGEVDSFG